MKTSPGLKLDPAKVSAECRRRNPHIFGPHGSSPIATEVIPETKRVGKRRKEMNKTEAEFARILEAKRVRGEIVSFDYEGMTLRWGTLDSIKYTADFCVIKSIARGGPGIEDDFTHVLITLIEVKGAHIWPQDMQKFKQARNEWPLFRFEMHRKIKGEWEQIA